MVAKNPAAHRGFVTSRDGTRIAYERTGTGPPLVFVNGALGYKDFSYARRMAAELAKSFTVHNYDRRGRGESGDAKPYAVEREVEDLAALAREAGGSPLVLGTSSGAALALEAAARGVPMAGLAAFEPPYLAGDADARPPPDYREHLEALVAQGRRDEAVKYFMRTVGVPRVFVAVMRLLPFWKGLRATAHTLPYDAAVMGNFEPPRDRLARIRVPTLVLSGAKSPPGLRNAAEATAAAVPGARLRSLPGQTHAVKPAVLVPEVRSFFAGTAAQITGAPMAGGARPAPR